MNDNIKFLVSVNDGGQLHTNLYSEDEYNNNVMPLLSKNYTPDQYSVTGLQDTISDNITEDNQYLISVSSNGHTYSKPYSGKDLLGGKLTEISRQFPDYHIQYIDGAVRVDDTSDEIVSIPWQKQLSNKLGQLVKSTTKTMEQTNEVAEEAKSTSLSDLLAERGDALRNFANMAVYNGLTKTPEELEEMHAKELEEREARRKEQEDVQRLEETRKQISEINKQLGEWSVREQAAGEEDFGGENIDWIVKNAERKAKLLKKRAELVKQQSENPMYRKEEKRIEGIAEDIRDKAYKVASDISVEGDLVTYNNPEADTWQAARYFADNALKTINAPDDTANGFNAFLKGAGDTFSNVDFWTMGLESISSNTKVKRVFNKIADKVNNYSDKTLSETDFDNILTDAEKELIKSFVSASEAQALRAYDTNNMYNAGTIAADSVGFMAQFILTGGVGEAFAGATKTAAKGFAKWIAKNTGKVGKRAAIGAAVASQTLVGRGAAKLADAVATPVLKAVPMTLMQTGLYKNYAEKLTERDDAGNLTYDYDTAILPALRDAGLEVWSEMALEPVLAVFGKTISKGIANLPKTSKVGAFMQTKLDDITSFLHNREAIDILTKAGFDGYFEEIGEEILAAGVSSMWEPEAWSQFWEKDNLVSMAVAFAPMSVIGGGMSMANYVKRTMAYEEAAPKVRDLLLNRTNITEAQLNALFDRKSATMQDIADKISDIVKPIIESGAISADEFKALYDFAGATAQKDIAQALMDRMTTDARNNMRAELNEKTGGKTIYGKDKDGNETVSIYTDANGKKRYVIIDETSEDTLALSMDEQGGNIKIVDPSELEITTMPANQYLDAQVTAAKQVEEQNQIAQQQKQQKQSVMEALKARKPVKLYSPVSNLREDYIFLGWDGDMAVVANAQTGDEERRTVQEMANALNISPSILTKDQQTQMQVEKSKRYDSLARSANDYKGAPISYEDVSGSLLRVKSKGDEQGESYLEAQIVTESGEVVSVNVTPQQIEDFIAERKELVANAGAEANDRRAKDRERKARQAKDAEQYREAKAKFINPDGSIREGEWLENDPRSYAIYSDGKYGKKDTDATLRAALTKAQERAQKALAARDNESNPDFKQPLRDEYDHAVAALDTLDGLIAERSMDESASGALTPEQASEKFAEMEQMGLTSDEIIDLALQSIEETQARIDAIAKPQVSTDIPAYMEEKRKYAELVAAEQKKIDYWRSILNAPMTELERQNPDMANARMRRRMLDILTEKQSTKDAETLARLDAELQQVSEGFIGRAIADINKDNDNVVIVTEASVADRMRELGSKDSTIEQVLKAIADGDQPKGFFDTDTGVIFMVAENNFDVRDSQITFVHERQHKRTRARGLASVLIDRLGLSGLSEEEKKSALLAEMYKLFRGNFYDGKSALTIADELISYGVERVFRGDIDGVGLNETITNFVKNIDNERGETSNLSGAGAAAYGGASYRVGADGNAAVEGVGTTEVGGQGTGTAVGGEEESEGKVAYANGSTIQGLESYSRDELKQLIENHIANTLSGNGIDADIVAIELHGSRGRGAAREDSDLDAVVEYRGDIREDSMFNILNDDNSRLVIDGIGVDINPIRAEETGTMESYMKRSQEYDAQKIQQQAAAENEALFRATLQQAHDSAATSINGNKLPAAFNKIKWQEGSVNLDLGGGKFDNATEFLKGKGVENLIFDPFNRDAEWNKRIAEQVQAGGVDSVTCNNVLNVIDNEASRENVILQASKAIKPEGVAYFYIYEGDKSGIGKDKGQGRWQNNMTAQQYIPEISKYFADVKRRGQLIEAKNPLPTDEQSVWSFTGAYDGNNELRFSVANNNQQIFVSNALASLDKIQMKSGNAQAWINKIQQAGGLKKEEDKWIGLTDWLKEQGDNISKEDVAEFIREHQVQIEEVNYGEVTDIKGFEGLDLYTTEYNELLDMYAAEDDPADYAKNEMEARHGSNFWFHFFVNGGGEIDVDQESFDTYDEMFTTLQQYGVYPNQDVNSINPIRLDYTTEGLVNKREIALTVPTIAPWNKSDEIHFGDAGEGRAVAWIRFGSSKYYIPEYDNFYEFKKRMTEKYFPGTFGYNIPDLSKLTDEERAEYDRLESIKKSVPMNKSRGTVLVIDEIQSKRHQDGKEKGYDSVPDAPFRDSWDALAMKRMLRLAAEEGYDKIAWTSGQMQSDRYGLTKNLGDFYYKPNEDGTYKVSAALNQKRPGYTDYSDLNFDSLTVNGIGEIFGKEIAAKVSEGKGRKGYSHNNEGEWITFSGRDLKMANEGMRYFYDKRLVNWMNKYGKKWGVQVADLTLMNLENKEGWHSIDITPEMKESVMEGQPMFSVGGNSGYVGYSMSKRAANAREEGAYPKTDFKSNYGISQGMLDTLVSAGAVDNTEWHHTSKYGNKTTFYRWNDFAYKAFSENRESVESVYKDKSLSKEEKVSQIENIINAAIVPIREQYDALASEYEAVRQSIDILNKDREAERNAYLAEVRSNAEDFTASNGAIVRIGEDGPVAYDADGNRLSKRNGREMRDAALKEYEDNYDYYGSRFNFSKQQEFSDAVGRSIDLQSRMTSLINAERESAGGALFRATEIAGNPSLIAVHNLTESNLLDAFDLGGFPMPSIAITKADIGHTNFGDISLVFGKETINPKNQKNKVYSGDAWTPTFPKIGYKLNYDKTREITKRAIDVGELPLFNASNFYSVNYEDNIDDMQAKSLIDNLKKDYGAKQFFLAEQGNPVHEYEMREVEKYTEEGVRRIKELLDKIGLENLKGVDWNLTPEILQVVKGFLNANSDIDDSCIERIARNYVKNAIDYATHGNKTSEVDYDATRRKIDERIDQSAFEKWLEDLFSGIVEKRGIRNEVDPFTPIGNRRAWEKLYDEVTLDNVVKAMSKKPKRGGSGFFGGNIFGASAKTFNSISDIRKEAASSLAAVKPEEIEKQKQAILDRLSEVKVTNKELGITEMFDLTENIRDAVAKSHTADGIHRYLKDYYPDITMGAAQEIADIVKDIQSISTKYFEAKPYRAVGFDEVKLAIVPEGTSQAVVDGLLERGVPVRTYEKNNRQERMDIISNATEEMGLRFRTIEITPEVRDEMYQIEALARLRGKYLKAPNGADTKLKPEQWALVRTKNYTAWFGDWENDPENASKVLDENGEPMVMYHGGKGEITTFNPARIGSNIDNGTMGAGFYFTSDKQNADNYARNAEGEGPVNTTSVYLNIRNPKRVRWNELSGDNKKESEAFTAKAKAQGYDGFIAEAVNGATWYVAFEPNQIKSATENNGEFSRENDDIRFSINDLTESIQVIEDIRQRRIGQSLTQEEAIQFVSALEIVSDEAPMEVDYNRESFDALFANGVITPEGKVKMGEGQFKKFKDLNRTHQLAYAYETLRNPDFITHKKSTAKGGQPAERDYSKIYGKVFTISFRDAESIVHYNSISVLIDGSEIVISNYAPNSIERFRRELKEGSLTYIKKVTLPSESGTSAQGDQRTTDAGTSFVSKDTNSSETSNASGVNFSVTPATQLRKKGLADSLTEEQMSSITNDAFASMDEQTRRKIAAEQIRLGGDLVQPVMDYISRIAETPEGAGISQMDADIIEGVRQNLIKMVDAEDEDITTNDTLWLVYDYVHGDDTYIYDAIKNRRIRRALGQARSVAPEMSLDDYLKAAAEAKDDIIAEYRALRKLADSLTSVMDAMEARRDFDRATVGRVVKLANSVMSSNLLDDMTKGEVKRITGVIRRATGMRNIQTRIYELYNIILNNNLRRLKNLFEKELKRKASKVGSKNVVEQGRLDLNGQKIMAALKDNLDKIAYDDNGQVVVSQALFDRINDAMDRSYSEDKAVSNDAELELIGLSYARQYIEGVAASEKEEQDIKDSLKEADQSLADGKLDKKSHGEFVKEQARALAECRTERVKAFTELVQKVQDMSAASHDLAIKFVEQNKERIAQIHHEANSDLEGVPANEHPAKPTVKDRLINSSITKFFLRPLGTFDMLLRMLGRMSPNGEGYLWNRYMRGWVDAASNEYTGIKNAKMMLDAKVSEIFGKKMVWSDLYAMVNRMPKATVKFWDGGEMREHEVTQGNLLYIMLADQMTDGRMKLRAMGITEDDVDAIRAQMDSRFISLADWIVHDFLPSRREAYNAVHERMFGAPMSKVQNYFPLRILSNARTKQVDVATGNVEQATPSTVTGNIMKRTRNALALDIMGTDAFVLVMDHVQKMEHWAAFAEWNRDLSDLLSYKRFRNKVQNMTSIYGAKNDLYNEFVDVAMIAAGSYRTKSTKVDVAAGKLAKGVTGAKISFRLYTALKQLQSAIAYFSDANPIYIAEGFIKGWKWSKENLPMFEKRIKARDMGDQNLSQSMLPEFFEKIGTIGMSPNVGVDAFTVSAGAYALYKTKYENYIKMGFSKEAADKRAKQDAVILYNETQQSSEAAFLSTLQTDRTWLSKMLSVFRNSSFAYTRQVVDASRNLAKRAESGYKRTSIEYLTKQLIREGLSDTDALKAAKDIYNRQGIKDTLRLAIYGYILPMTWGLLSSLPYLIFGDDDDKKEEMMDEAMLRMVFGPIEGLAAGNTLAEFGYKLSTDMDFTHVNNTQMPIVSDITNVITEVKSDSVRALNDIVNLATQMLTGANPQTFEDAIIGIIDACNGDLGTTKETLLLALKVINAPQSSIDQLYLDEIDMSAKGASELSIPELASRYAKYKKMRNAGPFTPLYSFNPELDEKTTQKYIRQFESKAKERMKIGEENDFAEISEEAKALNDRISSLRKKANEGDSEADRQLMEIFMSPDYAPLMRFYKLNEEMNSYINKAIRAKSNEEMADYLEEANRLRGEMVEDYRNDPSEKAYFRDIYARYSYGILPEMSRLDKKYKEEYAESNPDYLAWEEQHKEERANAAAKAEANAQKILEIDAQLKKYEVTLPNGKKRYFNMPERKRLYAEKKRIREEGVTEKQILNRIDKTKPKYTEEDYMPEDIYNSPEYQIYLEMRELGSLSGNTFKFKSIESLEKQLSEEGNAEQRDYLIYKINENKMAIAKEISAKLIGDTEEESYELNLD